MTTTTMKLAKARLHRFAVEAYREGKQVRCNLMQMKHCTAETIPQGFKVTAVDNKPFIGRI